MKQTPAIGLLLALLLGVLGCAETSTVVDPGTGKDTTDTAGEPDDGIIIGPQDVQDIDLMLDFAADKTADIVDAVDELDFTLPDLPDAKPDEVEPDLVDVVELKDVVEIEEIEPDLPPEIEPDEGSCTPSCGNKQCGSDGCGGVCGYCAYGQLCSPEGQCIDDVCPKQCTTEVNGEEVQKECGYDGCGGYCGYCLEEGEVCGADGFCYAGSCTPDCDGKACGPDGCGGSCGFCQVAELCNEESQCVPHPCGTITYKGQCADKYTLEECVNLEVVQTMCKEQPDMMCGWDENVGKYACVEETECGPQCAFDDGTPKECGPDGCWGECGVCPQGWGCGAGLCLPASGGECAWIDATVGICVGAVNWFCSSKILYGYDCFLEEGKDCGWNPNANFGLGGYDCI